ncbi:MAG: DNA mismatch repair protein MutS [Gemmatimonadales bacterium]
MRPHLLDPLGEAPPGAAPGSLADALIHDLDLDIVLDAMAAGDARIREVARSVVLGSPGTSLEAIRHRQAVLEDCLRAPEAFRALYRLATEAIEGRRRRYGGYFGRSPSGLLYGAIETLSAFLEVLREVRGVAEAWAPRFHSPGLTALCAGLRRELADAWLAQAARYLDLLQFRHGMLVGASLGRRNEGVDYILEPPPARPPCGLLRLLRGEREGFTFRIAERDDAGARALSHLRNRGLDSVANGLTQAADHVQGFFEALRDETGFYLGSLNLHARLTAIGVPIAMPVPEPIGSGRLRCRGLADVSLALRTGRAPVGNAFEADGRTLLIITGANQGGKSTLLRSLGLALLMMQSGMFVGAESCRAALCSGLFTHFTREEDATMTRGKLEEELARLRAIVDACAPGAWLLLNESFAATNERAGSALAREVVLALVERGLRVGFVTHLYLFAHAMFAEGRADTLFLRAERGPGGARSYRVTPGEPMETSYGQDVLREVFGPAARPPEGDPRCSR